MGNDLPPSGITRMPAIVWRDVAIPTSQSAPSVKIGGVPVAQISENLFRAARSAARSALLSYTDGRVEHQLRCALEVGAAAEWLVRALLARSQPVLLADRGKSDSVLALAGVRPMPPALDHTKLRTITTTEVVALVGLIHPRLGIVQDHEAVMGVRNSAAHMAIVTEDGLHGSARRLVRIVAAVIPEFDTDADAFWGPDLASVARRITVDFDNETAARVASKIAAAKQRISQLTAALPPEGVSVTLATLEARQVPEQIEDDFTEEEYSCPACGRRAWISYLHVRDDGALHVDYDDDGAPEHEYVVYEVTLVPALLQCPVCELSLDGAADELDGLPQVEERTGDSIYTDAEDYYVRRLWDDD